MFFGHSHSDQWKIHFDAEDDTRPIGVAFIAPSMTTYTNNNPSFRIVTVDGGYEGATYVSFTTDYF